jgi:hypothetical protein
MVTGIEAAGIVLAIFPFVVRGIDFHLQGIETLRRGRSYREILKRLKRDLRVEHTKLQNTCDLFLGDSVSSQQMMNSHVLGEASREAFEDLLAEIKLSLQKLASAIGIGQFNPNDPVSPLIRCC